MTKITIMFAYGGYDVYANDSLLFANVNTIEECYRKVAEYFYAYTGNVQVAEFYV